MQAKPSSTMVLWRGLDAPGHDACVISIGEEGVALRGCAVFREGRRLCRPEYARVSPAGIVQHSPELFAAEPSA